VNDIRKNLGDISITGKQLPTVSGFVIVDLLFFVQRMVNLVKITREQVEHVAKLARLALTEEEIASNTEQLNSILEYAAMLEKLDTEDIVPTAHAVPLHNVLREDAVAPSMERDKVLKNAPDAEDGFFKVPKIV
jgi:aspartyl-tRNA(Asn)/glutamyl-tRNA(Gln) amidotransferase subunit C